MKRDIIKIDEDKCNGCGLCVPNCHEGALQIIDGKVRLVSELMCDGLGACIGYCPEGAITIETREAVPYNETKVMEQMIHKGKNTVKAHLKHLNDHGETGYLGEAIAYLESSRDLLSFDADEVIGVVKHDSAGEEKSNSIHHTHSHAGACPGSREMVLERPGSKVSDNIFINQPSELRQWPVQMHLLNPSASYLKDSDLLLAADCVAFTMGDFHARFLKGKSLAIACPKLDHGLEIYVQKLTAMIETARVNTITIMMMEVPCCGGLLQMVRAAQAKASRKLPVRQIIVGIGGDVLKDEWL
jgi:NAD-dependent dihydropyrimidine dehydrogenase PreA subunit